MGQLLYQLLAPQVSGFVCGARADQSRRSQSCRSAALLGQGTRLSRHALQPAVSSEFDLAKFESALSAVARGGKTRRGVQFLYLAAPDADAGGYGGTFLGRKGRGGSFGRAGSQSAGSLARFPQDVSPEKIFPGLDQRIGALRNFAGALPVPRYMALLQNRLRRIWRQAIDLGYRLSTAALGAADG